MRDLCRHDSPRSTRKSSRGLVCRGAISREEALRMYTLHAAFASFRDHELGSITPGKLADLVVLEENLLTCDPKALLSMRALYTIVNGKVAMAVVGK